MYICCDFSWYLGVDQPNKDIFWEWIIEMSDNMQYYISSLQMQIQISYLFTVRYIATAIATASAITAVHTFTCGPFLLTWINFAPMDR